jgi:hypothetical protein
LTIAQYHPNFGAVDAQKLARRCLLASIAIYGAMLFLAWLRAGPDQLWFLIAICAVAGMTLSASACIALQVHTFLRKRGEARKAQKP